MAGDLRARFRGPRPSVSAAGLSINTYCCKDSNLAMAAIKLWGSKGSQLGASHIIHTNPNIGLDEMQ